MFTLCTEKVITGLYSGEEPGNQVTEASGFT